MQLARSSCLLACNSTIMKIFILCSKNMLFTKNYTHEFFLSGLIHYCRKSICANIASSEKTTPFFLASSFLNQLEKGVSFLKHFKFAQNAADAFQIRHFQLKAGVYFFQSSVYLHKLMIFEREEHKGDRNGLYPQRPTDPV